VRVCARAPRGAALALPRTCSCRNAWTAGAAHTAAPNLGDARTCVPLLRCAGALPCMRALLQDASASALMGAAASTGFIGTCRCTRGWKEAGSCCPATPCAASLATSCQLAGASKKRLAFTPRQHLPLRCPTFKRWQHGCALAGWLAAMAAFRCGLSSHHAFPAAPPRPCHCKLPALTVIFILPASSL